MHRLPVEPLAAIKPSRSQVQAQGLHEGGVHLGLQPNPNLGPVAHFDGRDHARSQGKGRGHRSSAGAGSSMGIDGGIGGGMLGAGAG